LKSSICSAGSACSAVFGLMGLLAEETLIGQRLGKLGRKKPAAQ